MNSDKTDQAKNKSKANYMRIATMLLKQESPYVESQTKDFSTGMLSDADYVVYDSDKKGKKLFSFHFISGKKCAVTLDNGESLQLSALHGAVLARKLLVIRDGGMVSAKKELEKESTKKMSLMMESVKEALRM